MGTKDIKKLAQIFISSLFKFIAMFLSLAIIAGIIWLLSPSDATAASNHGGPPPMPNVHLGEGEELEMYQTSDGHWHYVKHKIQQEFPLGWFLLAVVLLLILVAVAS